MLPKHPRRSSNEDVEDEQMSDAQSDLRDSRRFKGSGHHTDVEDLKKKRKRDRKRERAPSPYQRRSDAESVNNFVRQSGVA